jgi:hypothetical protein
MDRLLLKYFRTQRVLLPALVLAWCIPVHPAAIPYGLTVVAQTGDTIDGKELIGFQLPSIGPNSPAISAGGEVAFYAIYKEGGFFGEGIFTPACLLKTGDGTPTALVGRNGISIDGHTLIYVGPPATNARGTVAFQGWLSKPGETAILTPATVIVKTGDTISGKKLTDLFFAPALNASDTVAFVGVFSDGIGIFTQKSLLVQVGDVIGGQKLTSLGLPVINDAGIVAYTATTSGGMGVFTQSSLIAKTGDAVRGKTVVNLGPPAINSSGEVAFVAMFSDSSSAVILARPAGR